MQMGFRLDSKGSQLPCMRELNSGGGVTTITCVIPFSSPQQLRQIIHLPNPTTPRLRTINSHSSSAVSVSDTSNYSSPSPRSPAEHKYPKSKFLTPGEAIPRRLQWPRGIRLRLKSYLKHSDGRLSFAGPWVATLKSF